MDPLRSSHASAETMLLGPRVMPAAQGLLERITAHRTMIAEASQRALLALPGYESLDDESAKELGRQCLLHLDAFLQAAQSGRLQAPNELGFIAEAARDCARNGLDARPMLKGYRLCPRVKAQWIMRIGRSTSESSEAALALVRVLMEFSLHASGIWTDAYLAHLQRDDHDGDMVAAGVIEDLMSGVSGPQLDSRARRAGMDPSATNHLALVAAMDLAAATTATRRQLLMNRSPHLMIAFGDELVVVTPARVSLSDMLRRACELAPLRAGISLPFTGLDSFTQAYDEAMEALSLTTGGRVVRLQDLRLFDYLLIRPAATARRLVPAELGLLDAAHRRTLRTYAECDLNAEVTARHLNVHPNTVYNRLRKIGDATGRDARRVTDLIDLLAGLTILEATPAVHAASPVR